MPSYYSLGVMIFVK